MPYRRKFLALSCLAAALACVYIMTFVFDPALRRSDAYAWLDPRLRDSVDRIDFTGGGSGREGALSLLRRNGRWLVLRGGLEYPAREARVADLLDLLSRRGAFPLRSASPASHALFGLSESAASRITLRGGAGLPLLDLLVGRADAGGGSLYMRKADGGEVRSGDGGLSAYIDNEARSWYDLRLFPETEALTADSVQRLTVIPPVSAGGPASDIPARMVISRAGNAWRVGAGDRSLEPGDIEKSRVDSYINGIFGITGDDFVPAGGEAPAEELSAAESSAAEPFADALIFELGDGRVLTLRLGPPGEGGTARISGLRESGAYGYALASWALERIFRPPEYFRRPE
ncbi:MAG: DUF4340 domain-containing protein [Treponema sp.]|jgi:hypothetical protein|nr:DUF4340 domain-containing protein [Treponema sp.]